MEISDSVYRANHIDPRRDIDRVFVRGSVEQFTWRGKIFGVPLETDGGIGSVVNVPVDDVRKLGLANKYPPTNGKFWFESYDDLFALAKALQVVKNGRVVKYGLSGEGWDDTTYWGIMLTEGTKPFDPEHKKFNFNTPAGVEAMYLHVEKPVKLGIETKGQVELLSGVQAGDTVVLSGGYGLKDHAKIKVKEGS